MSSKRWEARKQVVAALGILMGNGTDEAIDQAIERLEKAKALLTPPSKTKKPHEYRRTGVYARVKTP